MLREYITTNIFFNLSIGFLLKKEFSGNFIKFKKNTDYYIEKYKKAVIFLLKCK